MPYTPATSGLYTTVENTSGVEKVFGFLGIDNIEFVSAEGLSISPEHRANALDAAQQRIERTLALAA